MEYTDNSGNSQDNLNNLKYVSATEFETLFERGWSRLQERTDRLRNSQEIDQELMRKEFTI